jgi:acetyl esterase/lipase
MVMARRPEVQRAPLPIATLAVVGLAAQLATALASVPFRRPWTGGASPLQNLGIATTRTVVRSFVGYATSLPTPEFRSLELVLDDLCRALLPPLVRRFDVAVHDDEIGGVPGIAVRPRRGRAGARIVYLHGGGYIGTSPAMYALFTGWLARKTGCEVFVPDYRLAPEFPFPASLLDAIAVYEGLLARGQAADRLFVAGDSGGGGLVNALTLDARAEHLPTPAGLLLFSPEVSLTLDEPSIVENAARDVLPWNIPVQPYLHGADVHDRRLSVVDADLHGFPPTFLAFGSDEMFRDAIRRFAERLSKSDVETTVLEEPQMFHAFPMLMPWAPASGRVFAAAAELVDRRLARARPHA